MKGQGCLVSGSGRVVTEHVQSESLLDTLMRSYSIHALLHFIVPTIGAFDCVGRGRQQRIIQKGQGLLQVGREYLLEGLANLLETADVPAELGQFGQGRVGAAAPVK